MKTRIMTSIIMMVTIIPIILLGGIPFYVLLLLVVILGSMEIFNAFKSETSELVEYADAEPKLITKGWPLSLKIINVLFVISFIIYPFLWQIINKEPISFALSNFIFPIVLVVAYISLLLIWAVLDKRIQLKHLFFVGFFSIFFGIALQSILLLRGIETDNLLLFYFNKGFYLLFFPLLICILTDTFAYFIGFCFGLIKGYQRHKLIERVSPKKTIEGAVGGFLFGALIPFAFAVAFNWLNLAWWAVLLISSFLSIIAQFGDLVFSLIKRNYGLKDFSNIFPGHGGIFDRLDSILFACITFACIISLL
ncbi:MAG: phosphatidate cytidylyltransferase [Bacillales bacterium]|nr:phosphatidate cytidylyltransferase [Bacillales bacterium]